MKAKNPTNLDGRCKCEMWARRHKKTVFHTDCSDTE